MSIRLYALLFVLIGFGACDVNHEHDHRPSKKKEAGSTDYFDQTGRTDVLSGGVRKIEIQTAKGPMKVWTKRVGNNPKMKLLLLHGGPGATHEYFECFDSFMPGAGIEFYYYDQLDSKFSDQHGDSSLWTIEHYVEEVEQVRQALGLTKDNFYLLGHSWGGILGIEYAMKYQDNLKGLIISNMMASIPEYIKYANEVLGPQLPTEVLAELKDLEAQGKYTDPRYLELAETHYYPKHVMRLEDWPDPVVRGMSGINYGIYLYMQGPSEFGIVGDATLKNWDRSGDLGKINVPTLSIGGQYDTMDPKYKEWMATQFPKGRYLHCPAGSHFAMYDDQETYFKGLIKFIKDVDKGKFADDSHG